MTRRTQCSFKRHAGWGAIVALAAFYSNGFSAPGPNDNSLSDRSELEARRAWSQLRDEKLASIAEEESINGPLSRALIDPLLSLGLAYQEYGEHDLAIVVMSRALQIMRVHEGLNGLDQVPLLRQLIVSELASRDFASAAVLERRILELARLHPDDARSVAIFRAAGDRQLAAYEHYLAGDRTLQVSTAVSPMGASVSRGPAPSGFALWEARRNYTDAMRSILRTQGYQDEALPELERALIRTYYLELRAQNYGPERAQMLYYLGRDSYRRLVAYSGLNDGSVLGFAKALVELADWDLLFSRNAKALERYEHAHAVLVTEGVPEAAIRELFSPEVPVLLPAFLPSPFDSGASGAAHIDVEFELGKYGTSRRIEILEVSANTTNASEKEVVRLIGSNRFRPRLRTDDAAAAPPYQVRYYVNE